MGSERTFRGRPGLPVWTALTAGTTATEALSLYTFVNLCEEGRRDLLTVLEMTLRQWLWTEPTVGWSLQRL